MAGIIISFSNFGEIACDSFKIPLFFFLLTASSELFSMPQKRGKKRRDQEIFFSKKKKKKTEHINYKELFRPSICGLKGNKKPSAMILLSPREDEIDGATSFLRIATHLDDVGYKVVNKKKDPTGFFEEWKVRLSVMNQTKELVVWVFSHGAPGYFFGDEATEADESYYAIKMAVRIQNEAFNRGLKIKAVVLDSCFSGNETFSIDCSYHLKSPARMLSEYLPDVTISLHS